ncbi:unnamed protein product [Polarella glacialis]|uniref:Uncharacterized protein n=1 Tax=Polarella glacialis TaxID=89957 RepID=A0A813IP86_POLGL|nr:unnamed protein product [Polarella glacialis]
MRLQMHPLHRLLLARIHFLFRRQVRYFTGVLAMAALEAGRTSFSFSPLSAISECDSVVGQVGEGDGSMNDGDEVFLTDLQQQVLDMQPGLASIGDHPDPVLAVGAASAEQPAAADALDELVPLDQGDTDPAVLNDFHLPHDFMSSRPSAVVAGLSFQNDVTNSSNWRNKKLSSLEALISILRNVDALADGHFDKAFAKMRGLRQSQCNEQRVACRVDLSLG